MRKILILLCLALSGCMAFGQRGGDAAMAVYDLGPPAARWPAAAAIPPFALDVRSPAWLDSPQIHYRLAYAEPLRLRAYARARWAGPPAALVRQRLMQQLGSLLPEPGGGRCLLHIEMDEFSQVFATPEQSRGVLQVRLAWLDGTRRVLAAKTLAIDPPAPGQDSRGGAAALAAAVERLGGEIVRWRGELAGSGRLGACGE